MPLITAHLPWVTAAALNSQWESRMPKGSKVHRMYEAIKRGGADKGKAARIAQAKTGQALATGKAPKNARKGGGK
jgi:hypothetical protein